MGEYHGIGKTSMAAELVELQLREIIKLKDELKELREKAVQALRKATGKAFKECEDLLDDKKIHDWECTSIGEKGLYFWKCKGCGKTLPYPCRSEAFAGECPK